jgi:hypothetical protein
MQSELLTPTRIWNNRTPPTPTKREDKPESEPTIQGEKEEGTAGRVVLLCNTPGERPCSQENIFLRVAAGACNLV